MSEYIFIAAADGKVMEKISVVYFPAPFRPFILKEAAYHELIKCFAEATGTGKENCFGVAFEDIPYHQCFIYEISVSVDDFLKVLHADGYFLFIFFAHLHRSLSAVSRFYSSAIACYII